MQRVAKDMMAAARTGSSERMAVVINRHGDVKTLGKFSLGSYLRRLPRSRWGTYYSRMVGFMSRYVIRESRKYDVVRASFARRSFKDELGTNVDSTVTLSDGSTYNVRWLLTRRNGRYRVRDAQVYGFWLSPFQRNLFRNFVREQGGDVNALLAALGS